MQSGSVKKLIAAGGVLVVLGIGAVGVSVVQAQQSTPTPNTQQQQRQGLRDRYLQELASELNVSVDKLKQAMQDARKKVGLPEPGTKPAPGTKPGPGGRGFGRGFGYGFGAFFGKEADAVAGLFNENRAALMNELPGKTLAEVAAAHSVSTQTVVDTIVKTANEQIDQAAQAKNLPAERVTQLKQQISERAQEFVTTHRFPARGTGVRS
jgi:predicted DNA-binding protein YlxM (UPF0122 family)